MSFLSGSSLAVQIGRRTRPTGSSILAFLVVLAGALTFGEVDAGRGRPTERDNQPGSVSTNTSDSGPPAIVIGFVGGFIRHDDPVHSEVQLAARLRQEYPSGVNIETFESYRGEAARRRILGLLDIDHDGVLTTVEKQSARIILYGHSWGGSEALQVARELDKDGVPVLLTIQVDSVSRFLQNDQVIPPNVAAAANFYQPDGLVHGEPEIRAADPARTTIIGNFKFVYKSKPYTCAKYPWYDHYIVRPHTQIECDPSVWKKAEDLIRTTLAHEKGAEKTAAQPGDLSGPGAGQEAGTSSNSK